MQALIEQKNVKARKPYKCDYCGRIIVKGEVHDWQKYIYDGSFYEWRCHLSCARVASAIWEYVDPDEGMSDQDFMDGCQEVCQRFICPDCPHWDKEYEGCDNDESYCIDRMDEFFQKYELYCAGRQGYAHIYKCREKTPKEESEYEPGTGFEDY